MNHQNFLSEIKKYVGKCQILTVSIFLNGTPFIFFHILKEIFLLISNIPYILTFGLAVFALLKFKGALIIFIYDTLRKHATF